MATSRCPEAVYGEHGPPNSSGRCLYCGANLGPRSRPGPDAATRRQWRAEQDPLNIDPREDDYYDT